MLAARVIELLGAFVVRLEVVVRDRPRGREAIGVLDLFEVLAAEPVEYAAPELRVAADAVVGIRPKRTAVFVQPLFADPVSEIFPHRFRIPVFLLARNKVAALEREYAGAGIGEGVGKRAAARAGPDDGGVGGGG